MGSGSGVVQFGDITAGHLAVWEAVNIIGDGGAVPSGGVTSLNTLSGNVTLSAGSNITLTPSGNDIAISASGGGSPSYIAGSGTATASGTNSLAGGGLSVASGNESVCLGYEATDGGFGSSIVIGYAASSGGGNSVTVGVASEAGGANGVAIGNTATAAGTNGIAIGTSVLTSPGGGCIAIGYLANANGASSIAIGDGAYATGANDVYIGNSSAYHIYINGTTGAITTNGSLLSAFIDGITDGSNATAGYIGEYISSTILNSSAVSLTNNTAKDITSIILTAGDWDVEGNINFCQSSVSMSSVIAWSSETSATMPDNSAINCVTSPTSVAYNQLGVQIPKTRINVTTNTTIYLSGYATFSGLLSACGNISARRVR